MIGMRVLLALACIALIAGSNAHENNGDNVLGEPGAVERGGFLTRCIQAPMLCSWSRE